MAEIVQIKFKVDGKEITATEKDLKELQKATKKAEQGAGGASKGIDKMGVALKALGAVAAAVALFKFAEATVAAVKETENLARLAGISTTEFQKQAVAARSVGIEADKLADIYKDVDDKLGDFVTTGAGPLADFFEGIGKQMGVTIDDFKELSSDQALGLYVKTLEEANASQAEMTFFMEAIASDSSLLTPLLKDNGAAMKELGDAATGVLSAETIEKASALDAKFKQLADTVKGQVTLAVVDATTAMGEFLGILEKPIDTEADKALQKVLDLGAEALMIEQEIKRLRDSPFKQGPAIASLENQLKLTNDRIKAATQVRTDIRLEGEAVAALAATEKEASDAKAKADQEARAGMIERDALAETARIKAEAAAASAAKAQAAEIEAFRNLADPMKQYTDKLERIRELMILSEDDPETVEQLVGAYVKVAEAASEAAGAQAKVNEEAAKTEAQRLEDLAIKWEAVTDFASIHKADLAELQELLAAGTISAEQYAEQIMKIAKGDAEGDEGPFAGLIDELTSLETQMKKMKTDAVVGLADAIADFAVTGEKNFKEFARSMIAQIAKIIIKLLILKAIQAATGSAPADTGPAVPSASTGGTSRDSGGSGRAGDAFLIGTGAQPELFVPQTAGQFIPKSQLGTTFGGGGGVQIGSINVVVKEKEGETSQEQAEKISKAIARDLKQMVQGELIQQQRSGNILNPAGRTTFR